MHREFGILIPKVSVFPESPSLKYDPSTSTTISRSPMTRDLYESRYVFVRQSAVAGAGEGLWAKCGISDGQVCALFNGVRLYRWMVIIKLSETKNEDKYDEWKLCRQSYLTILFYHSKQVTFKY